MVFQFEDFEINPIHNGDAWKICNFCVANEDRLKRFFPSTLAQNLTPTLSQQFVEKKVKQFETKTEFLFTLKHSETRELAGLIYLKELNWTLKQGEFAYAIGYSFKGQNIITKAVKLLSKYAIETLGLQTLQIITHKDNLPSVKVAINNGYTWQKTLKNGFTPTGKTLLDMELYEFYN